MIGYTLNFNQIEIAIIEKILKLADETAFINITVGELLFDGYKDNLISRICKQKYIRSLCNLIDIPDRIGLFYKVLYKCYKKE